jgi:hypothetical protein
VQLPQVNAAFIRRARLSFDISQFKYHKSSWLRCVTCILLVAAIELFSGSGGLRPIDDTISSGLDLLGRVPRRLVVLR